ncbi:MAG TPA: enoyl-CoA hydratase/isomerase family protein [Anaerolineae bacterium]|nr:enoyl-CoA hydratase/isomerase family protein [Anaerolineae bacterium]
MHGVSVIKEDGIATVLLSRGKVNALNEPLVEQFYDNLVNIEKDETIGAILLTGKGKFFSFGFDVPEFLAYSRDEFERFLRKFTDLYRYLFLYPKPTVAALNGHTIAGGCMIATACDHRLMVSGKAKISLNEISFGASVTAGAVEMLTYCIGHRKAQDVLFSGAMFTPEEACQIGLIDQIIEEDKLLEASKLIAQDYINKDLVAFASIKKWLKGPAVERMQQREADSIKEFARIWYSENTWKNLQAIVIRD